MQALLRPHLRTGPALLLPVLLAKASQLSSKRRGNEWSCSHITKVWIIATKSLIHCMFIEYLLWALLTNRQTVPETKILKTHKASSTLDHHMFQVCSTPTTLYMASISAWLVFPHSNPNQTQNPSRPELCQHHEALLHPPRAVNLPSLYNTFYLHVIFSPSPRRPWQESEAALDAQGTAEYVSSIFNSDTVWQT